MLSNGSGTLFIEKSFSLRNFIIPLICAICLNFVAFYWHRKKLGLDYFIQELVTFYGSYKYNEYFGGHYLFERMINLLGWTGVCFLRKEW